MAYFVPFLYVLTFDSIPPVASLPHHALRMTTSVLCFVKQGTQKRPCGVIGPHVQAVCRDRHGRLNNISERETGYNNIESQREPEDPMQRDLQTKLRQTPVCAPFPRVHRRRFSEPDAYGRRKAVRRKGAMRSIEPRTAPRTRVRGAILMIS